MNSYEVFFLNISFIGFLKEIYSTKTLRLNNIPTEEQNKIQFLYETIGPIITANFISFLKDTELDKLI